MLDVLQFSGALMVLGSYFAMRRKWLDPYAVTYILLNAFGSGFLAIFLIVEKDWGVLILEGAWCVVSFWDLPKAIKNWRGNNATQEREIQESNQREHQTTT